MNDQTIRIVFDPVPEKIVPGPNAPKRPEEEK
jgi:hypothetical protein